MSWGQINSTKIPLKPGLNKKELKNDWLVMLLILYLQYKVLQ